MTRSGAAVYVFAVEHVARLAIAPAHLFTAARRSCKSTSMNLNFFAGYLLGQWLRDEIPRVAKLGQHPSFLPPLPLSHI